MMGVEKRCKSKPGLLVRYKIQMMSRDLVRSLGVGKFLDWGVVTTRGGRVVVLWENRKLELVGRRLAILQFCVA